VNQYGPLIAFVAALRDAGLRDVVISPGSRSTPLALSFAAFPEVRRHVILDERSAAYVGLGLALSSGRPTALVCTSGTAAANYLPAVVEARQGHVPLVVLTADRPRELRDVGAHQTVDQTRIYGQHAKWFLELPTDGAEDETAIAYARTAGLRAASVALARPFGPVHINVPLREPLLPQRAVAPLPPRPRDLRGARAAEGSPHSLLAEAAQRIREARRGLIVAGPMPPARPLPDLVGLARRTGFPLLADPLSGLRTQAGDAGARIAAYDLFLRAPDLRDRLRPDLVLRVGGRPTSKAVEGWIQSLRGVETILLPGEEAWRDPLLAEGIALPGEAAGDVQALLEFLGPTGADPSYLEGFRRADDAARRAAKAIWAQGELFEPEAIGVLSASLDPADQLFVGSSMPVRDLDGILPAGPGPRILAMRGASGIDGVLSAAAGAALAWGGRTALAIGDLSFLHDLGGLLAAARTSLTVLLLHNDGGGIFSYLPQHGTPHFEEFFGTPHGIDVAPAVGMVGGRHRRVTSREELATALAAALAQPGLDVVELRTDREASRIAHEEVFAAAHKAARAALDHV